MKNHQDTVIGKSRVIYIFQSLKVKMANVDENRLTLKRYYSKFKRLNKYKHNLSD